MATVSSIFGGNTGLTYDQVQARRKVADQLRAQNSRSPRNVGEGIHSIARALVARGIDGQTKRAMDGLMEKHKANPEIIAKLTGIPAYKDGTRFHPGGPAIVGEEGPELVELPRGAQVQPSDVALSDDAPSAEQLAEMGARAGIDAEQLRGLNLNSTQARNFGYVLRMMEAENAIRDLQDSNTFWERVKEIASPKEIEGWSLDPDYRRYTLARDNFNEAALRAATGATINQQEMPMQRQNYFPQPLDDADTRDFLRNQRQALMMALAAGSGPGASVLPDFGNPVVPQKEAPQQQFPAQAPSDDGWLEINGVRVRKKQ